MPLLIICGIPGSGKTTRALALQKFIEEKHGKEAVVVNEENLNLDKNTFYNGMSIDSDAHLPRHDP